MNTNKHNPLTKGQIAGFGSSQLMQALGGGGVLGGVKRWGEGGSSVSEGGSSDRGRGCEG